MSTPITISLYCNGRQKDYQAIFSDDNARLEFKVAIEDNIVCFEGSLEKSFAVKRTIDTAPAQPVDTAVLDAVSRQLNQIFF